jgi:hypothetical protein
VQALDRHGLGEAAGADQASEVHGGHAARRELVVQHVPTDLERP